MARVLVLVDQRSNQELLQEALSGRHDVVLAKEDEALDLPFDLGIVGGSALRRLERRIRERKEREVPAFLPFLLVTAREDVTMATRYLWRSIDDLVVMPIEKLELLARVESLLMTRWLSSELYHAMVEVSPVPIILIDRSRRVQQWNPASEHVFGWQRGEVVGRPLPVFEGLAPGAAGSLLSQVLRGERLHAVEATARRKDGGLVDIALCAAPLRDSDGEVRRVVVLADDISALRLAQQAAARRLSELEALNRIAASLRTAATLDEMLPRLLEETLTTLAADAGVLFLYDDDRRRFFSAVSHGPSGDTTSGFPPAEWALVGAVEEADGPCVSREFVDDPRAPAFLRDHVPKGWGGAWVPVHAEHQLVAALLIVVRLPRQLESDEVDLLLALSDIAGSAVRRMQLHEAVVRHAAELEAAYEATIEGWSRALDLRDRETEGHTVRVADMTVRLARALGLTGEDLQHVRWGALLHDIGKMGVPDAILLKPGPLTDEEWRVMRRHPELAYQLLEPVAFLRPALDIPYCHHEKWDGSGYPRGLRDRQIPLAARLFTVVDVWDALSSDRPYRPAWDKARVHQYLREQAGSHFDPRVVEVFLQVVAEGDAARAD